MDRGAALQAFGLDPKRPTGLVMFGGQGSMQMLRIAQDLANLQLILMCGHNARLATRLQAQSARRKHAAIGFTADVVRHMRMADYFIGKPGPGCLSEAVRMGLPVITFRNASTMPQERYNTRGL
jgi:UDP-N-acetylglucosamine:LPS N-acetylglucosamine transferase